MPFHVDYSQTSRTVAIRDASPIQFIICYELGSIVTLEATVNDYQNQRNVTFDWVQIDGNAVTLSHPNELITTFEFTDSTDKIFRFYIDKDTARETYIDCRVYHTPISFMGLGANVHNHMGSSVLKVVSEQDTTKTSGYSREIVPTVLSVPAVEFTMEYLVPAELLSFADKIEVYSSPDARVDPYILEETWDTQPYPTTYKAAEGYFVFVLHVTYPSGIKKVYSTHIQVSNPKEATANAVTHTTDDLLPIGQNVITSAITRYTFKKVLGLDQFFIRPINQVKTENLLRFGGTSCEGESSWSNPIIIGYNVKTSNLIKLDPSGIGSSG